MAKSDRRLVPWVVVLMFLVALSLGCSACLTLLSDYRSSESIVRNVGEPSTDAPDVEVIEDVTLAPRQRNDDWSQETVRPVDFFDSTVTRLTYN